MANGLQLAGGENYWTASGAKLSPSAVLGYSDVNLVSAGLYQWNSDTTLARLAAASMRLGGAPSATPVAQLLTIGEASRPSTDSNVGGASGTILSGLGTGTGTASSLIFQTPTLAASGTGTQTYGTRLTIATAAITATVPIVAANGAVGAPGLVFANSATSGFYNPFATQIIFASNGQDAFGYVRDGTNFMIQLASDMQLNWSTGIFSSSADLSLARLGAGVLRQGLAPNATPQLQIFTLGEYSRAGTDVDVGGSNGTLRSGLGTGTGTPSNLIFQTPTVAAAGSGAQTYATRFSLSSAGAVFEIVNQGLRINGQVTGAGAASGTLTNAPTAGDPAFWLPVNIAGTIHYIPCWV